MADVEIISEKPIDIGELKKELEKIKKRDKELGFRAQRTDEYLQHFSIPKNIDELVKKIIDLKISRLREIHIVKIVDILPKSVEELKIVLQAYPLTVNNDNMKKIVDVVNKFTAEK